MQPLNISGLHLCPVGDVCAHTYVWPYVSVRALGMYCNLSIFCSEFPAPAGSPMATSSSLGPYHGAGCDQREQISLNASLAQLQQRRLASLILPASAAPASKRGPWPQHLSLSWRHQSKSKMVSVLLPPAVRMTTLWSWQGRDPGARALPSLSQPASPWEQRAVTNHGSWYHSVSLPVTLRSLFPHPPLSIAVHQGGSLLSPRNAPCVPSVSTTPPHSCVHITKAFCSLLLTPGPDVLFLVATPGAGPVPGQRQ